MEIGSSYDYEFLHRPDYGFLKVRLKAGQTICVEASSMASMDTNIAMKTKMKGGVMASLKRGLLTGESVFINEFTAENAPGELMIAPGSIGDVTHYPLQENKAIYLQSASYVASSPEVQIDTKWGGVRGFFSGTGLFLVKASGSGDLFFNSFGALIEVPVEEGYIIDTGYVVAFEETLQYHITTLGGLKTTLLGGDGFVCHFTGKGRVWLQTRKFYSFASWLWPFRPAPKRNH
ncbi:MAG: TIGR00266 family protein [Planctomycetota bacterium]